jgi:hypothetical protein
MYYDVLIGREEGFVKWEVRESPRKSSALLKQAGTRLNQVERLNFQALTTKTPESYQKKRTAIENKRLTKMQIFSREPRGWDVGHLFSRRSALPCSFEKIPGT